jgi:hypothetical protein
MLLNFLWNTQLFWTRGAWYKSPVIMTFIFPKKWLCVCLMDLRRRSIKEIILLLIRKTSYTTRNLAFCNCLMQLVSSCMRHMQLEIRPIAYDKLHEICSCMR